MADTSLTALQDEAWVPESPQSGVVGEILATTIVAPFLSFISGSVDTIAYRDGNDVSADVLSGSASATGNVLTNEVFTPDVAGRYVIVMKFNDSENTYFKKCLFRIADPADEP